MTVTNYSDHKVYFTDRFDLKYRLLGQIMDDTANYIIYENPRDGQRYIEEVKSKSANKDLLVDAEIVFIEDELLFNELYRLAIKEGILTSGVEKS